MDEFFFQHLFSLRRKKQKNVFKLLIMQVPQALHMLFHLIFKPKEFDNIVPAWDIVQEFLQDFNFRRKKRYFS